MLLGTLLLALGACASTANAAPLSMTFTEARANVGIQLSVTKDEDALFKAPNTAPFAAQINPGSGLITGGALQVPEFSTDITDPVNAHVVVDFEIGVINGSFNEATGALSLSGVAGGTLTANGKECNVSIPSPPTLTLTTDGSTGGPSPLHGTPFTHGLTGPGAIAGEWENMSATPVDSEDSEDVTVCNVVNNHIKEQGGVWLVQKGDVTPPPAPQLKSTNPSSPGSSGTPRIVGTAEAGSTVRLYAGSSCSGAPVATEGAAKLGSPGISVEVAEGATATFSATATDAAGNTSACSGSISYTHKYSCVVPNVKGQSLRRAKAALKAAHCGVGKVSRPKGRRHGALVVKSSKPSARKVLEAGGKVDLKLGPKPRKARPY